LHGELLVIQFFTFYAGKFLVEKIFVREFFASDFFARNKVRFQEKRKFQKMNDFGSTFGCKPIDLYKSMGLIWLWLKYRVDRL
jgi:hypothetical protein